MNPLIISLLSGILIFVLCAFLFTEDDPQRKMTLDRLDKVRKREFDISDANKKDNNLQEFLGKTNKSGPIEKVLEGSGISEKLRKLISKAGSKNTVDSIITMSLFIITLFGTLAFVSDKFQMVILIVGVLLSFFPFISLKIKAGSRANAFSAQFPEVLGLIASSLRAGHSLFNSFQIVTEDAGEPASSLFRTVVDDISLGRDSNEAIKGMGDIMPESLDLRFFITAVLIQREIGGNLAEILDSLGDTIRERFKLMGQLKAQTAQAKLSGIILTLVPGLIGGIIYMMNPEYMKPLFTDPTGKIILIASGVSIALGGLMMMKITDIEF